ncbi:MAG: pimeloyl-CoA dehydrogenase small subunit [Gammaproteobacteria bacterium]|nr:MAG: pimeloyl-CoA dehydrogenase small subunit [Gammaproteobacteria bacterium]
MDFNLSEEQTLLKDSVEKFISANYDLNDRRKLAQTSLGYSEDFWKQYADLGWLGLPFSESEGGFGGDLIDTMIMMEQLGKGLILEPYYASVILAGAALRNGGTAEQKDKLIGGIVSGEIKATVAYAEEQARFNLNDVATTAEKSGDGYVISGTKSVVANAETADFIIVAARTSGDRADAKGITLFLVDTKSEGVSLANYPTVDALRASEVTFANVQVSASDVMGELDNGLGLLEEIRDEAILALCAEAVGGMDLLYQDTVEYCKQREQFGHALSDFQTLKHRFSEMFIEAEQCRSLLYRATLEKNNGSSEARKLIHALKYKVGKAGRFIGQGAVQSHGGMGVTEELRIGHYFIRLAVIDSMFGNFDYHLDQYTELMTIPEDKGEEDSMPFM